MDKYFKSKKFIKNKYEVLVDMIVTKNSAVYLSIPFNYLMLCYPDIITIAWCTKY